MHGGTVMDLSENIPNEKPFNFDDYLKSTLGQFGRYQLFILILLCIPACFVSSWGSIDMVFIAYTPTHTCNETKTYNSLTNYSWTVEESKECSITYTSWNGSYNETVEDDTCVKWNFEKKYFQQTIITQWNLVCDEALVPRTIIALLNLSTLVATVYSFLQDRIGRKKAFFINLTVYLMGCCGSLLARSPIVFSVLKFVGGISVLWEIGFCWTLEFAGPSHRTTVTTLMTILYSLATASLALVAYLCSTWVQVGFCTSVPFVLLYLYYFIIPESPRWLLTQGRTEEVYDIIQRMARWNGVKIDSTSLQNQLQNYKIHSQENKVNNKIGALEFFKSSNLRWKNAFVTIIGIVSNQLYYAIPYSLENLEGNFLIAFVLQAIVEAPAALLNLLLINRFGRILPQSVLLFLAGLCCLLTWPLSVVGEYGAVAMAVGARFFASGAVAINEQVECELYPTVARGVGTSVSYVCYTLVGVATQYLLYTATVWNILPLLIMGSFTLVASFLCLFLPETNGNNLPDTIKEAELQGCVGWQSFKSHFKCFKKILRRFSNSIHTEKMNSMELSTIEKVKCCDT